MKKNTKRLLYLAAFILLMIIETCIAIFVHDSFVRPYMGDVLAVMVVYSFVRVIIPRGCKKLPLYVFIFAAGVEVAQYLNLTRLLGLENNRVICIILGGTFDWLDILCYGIGCLIIWAGSIIFMKTRRTNHEPRKQ